jgi:hypothetical protein
MQVLKIVGLGTLFLLLIIAAHTIIGALLGKNQVSYHAAVGLSALTAGTVYNSYFWLSIVVAYGAAIWVVKRSSV